MQNLAAPPPPPDPGMVVDMVVDMPVGMDIDTPADPLGFARFDSLPEPAVENIVRLLSQKSHLPEWRAYVHVDAVLGLTLARGSLRRAGLAMFTALRLEETFIDERKEFCDMLAVGPSLSPEDIDRDARLIRALAASITELRLARFPDPISGLVASHFNRLRHLSLSEDALRDFSILRLLRERGGDLTRLDLDVRQLETQHVYAVAAHCRSLRRLQLRLDRTTVPLTPIWRALRGRLEDLELGRWRPRPLQQEFDFTVFDVENIAKHCTGITCLRFCRLWGASLQKGMTDLCTMFGADLKMIYLEDTFFKEQELAQVLTKCPNAMMSVDPATVRMACAMGDRALGFVAGHCPRNGEHMGLDQVGAKCPNITAGDLSIKKMSQPEFRGLVSSPKPRLKIIRLSILDFDSMVSVLQVLAEDSVSLEVFHYTGPSPTIPIMQDFLRGNSRLRSLNLTCITACMCREPFHPLVQSEEPTHHMGMRWPAIMAVCLRAPKLKELECQCREPWPMRIDAVADVCVPVRHRGISVSLCRHQYC